MKKLLLILLLTFPLLASQADAKIKNATLINGDNKVVVAVNSAQAQYYFGLGYKLYNGSLGTAVESSPALFKTNLALPLTSTATSSTLISGTTRDGTVLNGSYCFTIDGNISTAEYVCGTASGTALTNLTRGIGSDGVTSYTALKFAHRYGAEVKITDFPVLQRLSRFINGDSQIPNKITYSPTVIISPTDATNTIANLDYVNNVATSGAPNISETVKGLGELATGQEAASSTLTGGTGARLVLPTSIATSTAGTAYTVPVTGSNGLIAPGFYQGNNNTFSGLNTFSATTTMATVTPSNLCLGGTCATSLENIVYQATTTAFGSLPSVATTTTSSGSTTVNLGFRPEYVELNYFIQGLNQSDSGMHKAGGTVTYDRSLNIVYSNSLYVTFSGGVDDAAIIVGSNGLPYGATLSKPNQAVLSVCSGSTAYINMSIQISSITDTGFTFSWTTTRGSSSGGTARFQGQYKAYR
jgi:hypothetical protein